MNRLINVKINTNYLKFILKFKIVRIKKETFPANS